MLTALLHRLFGLPPDVRNPENTLRLGLGLEPATLALLAALAFVLLAGAIMLYVRTRPVVGRSRASILLALRALQLALIVLVLADPLASLEGKRDVKSRLLMMVDASASMRECDILSSPDTLKRVAPALGYAPGADGTFTDAALRELRGVSRLDTVRRLLERDDARLWREAEARRELRLATFAMESQPSDASPTNSWAAAFPPASGEATFLGTALHEAISRHRGLLTEIVLFTDGVVNGGIDPLLAAQEARAAGVRVFPVPLGSPSGDPDSRLLSAAANLMVNKGDNVDVIVEIGTRGYGGKPAEVELRQGAKVLDHKPLMLQAGTHQRVALTYTADELGTFGLTAELRPQDGERNQANNVHQFTVEVVDDQYKVILVEGYPRWEYRFLKNLMARDRGLQARVALQCDSDSNDALPEDPKALDKTDVIVLGDASPRFYTERQLAAVEDFVSRRGGGLIVIAGEDYMPTAFRGSVVEHLLPVVLPAPDRPAFLRAENNAPFFVKLTPDGDACPAMRLEEDTVANAQAWANLPGQFWCRTADRLKPAAVALAEKADSPGHDPLPLIALQRYGKGQVLYMAIDSTWRWRYLWGEVHFERFWGQMIRNLAPDRSGEKRRSEITIPAHSFTTGDTVRIGALAYRADGAAESARAIPLVVEEAGTNATAITLTRASRLTPGEYEGEWRPPRDGSYLLRIEGRGGLMPAAAHFRVGPVRRELDETVPDTALLKQVADITGGSCFDPSALADLPGLLPVNSRPVEHAARYSLWDVWFLFALLAAANLGELILRRRWGLL